MKQNLEDLADRIEQLRAVVIADSCMLRSLLGTTETAQLRVTLNTFTPLSEDITIKTLFSGSSDASVQAFQRRLDYWKKEASAEVAAREAASPSRPQSEGS